MTSEVRWMGSIDKLDDFKAPIGEVFIDGKTVHGPWAIMSEESFRIHGIGLGTGKGQKYAKGKGGCWIKVAG